MSALTELAREVGATKIVWNRLYDPATVARDTTVKAGLRDLGFECESHNANLLHEPWEIRTGQGGPYRVFTPFWRACQMRLDAQPAPLPAPRRLRGPSQPIDGLALNELDLLPTIPWDAAFSRHWTPGEDGAQRRLEEFCGEWIGRYDEGRNRPDLPGSSRLSPHLHFGEIGPRQCLVAARNAVVDQPAGREVRRQFHPRNRLARVCVSPAASLSAHARTPTRRTLRALSMDGESRPAARLAARPHRLSDRRRRPA